jgi:hypothetical protein
MNNFKTNTILILVCLAAISYYYGFGPLSNKVVTLQNYDQIINRMTYGQVIEIVGEKGVELSQHSFPGIPGLSQETITTVYQWKNFSGSNMTAVFQNNQLVSKAQYGLQ